jgi:hypothetical protein
MVFASGPDEAPEFVTAWQWPPTTPAQEPVLRDPRGASDTVGSVAVAALDARPLQTSSPAQATTAPAAEAADGPGVSRASFTGCPPESATAAPGPLEAYDVDAAWHPAVPPAQLASPVDVRGAPPATAPSHAEVEVRTEPEQAAVAHATLPDDDATEDGPLVGCPGSGLPVTGSTATKSGADDAVEPVSPEQPPPVTVHSAVAFVPRACGDTAVSRALVADSAVPPQVPVPPAHSTADEAVDTLTGPETAATPGIASPVAGSRSDTAVPAELAQPPPSPCTVQLALPVLSRTPVTSPDAPPAVRTDVAPVHPATPQSAAASAVLDAASSRRACPTAMAPASPTSATRSLTADVASVAHSPDAVVQRVDALVVRTGAAPPAVAVPVTFPVVAPVAEPVHPMPSPQSTLAPAELDAEASPSDSAANRTCPAPFRDSSIDVSVPVPLSASHPPPRTSQDAVPVLSRLAPVAVPLADPLVVVVPLPEHRASSQSTSTVATLSVSTSSDEPSASDSATARQPPPATAQSAPAFVADRGAFVAAVTVPASWPAP